MKAFLLKHYPAILLFLFSFLAYGLMIPWLGFYWDDWPMAWFANTLGPLGFKDVLALDRPFLTGIYMLTTSLFPSKPIYWQIFALFSRWVCGISVYWALTKLWPDLKKQMLWVSILFTLFPGFKQQPIAMIYGNGFVLLTSFFISLGLMINALQQTGKKKVVFILSSILLQLFTIFSTEYYAGLELLRILIIWYKRSLDIHHFKIWFQEMVREYYPYAIGLIIFLIWRVFIFKFPTYQPVSLEEIVGSSNSNFFMFVNRMVQDIYLAVWGAWSEIFKFPDLSTIKGSGDALYWSLVILLTPLSFFLLKQVQKQPSFAVDESRPFQGYGWQIVLFAASAIVLGALPFWATNLPIQLKYPYDRFFLSLMFGSSLLLVFLLEKFIKGQKTKLILFSLIIAFSTGAHLINANTYRREWTIQNEFFWQLSWRVPSLEENTMLVAETFPLQYYSDNSLTAPLNWIYDTSDTHIPLKYMMFFTDIRLGGSMPDLNSGTEVIKNYRSTYFKSTTDQTVGFFYTTDACLHILDPELSHDDPLLPETINKIINLSDPSRILNSEPIKLDESLFGKEPEHVWCYYYEKADLARQYKDWPTILELAQSVKNQSANAGSEYLPFSEAYAAIGDWETSMAFIQKAYNMDKLLEKRLCTELSRYQKLYNKSETPNEFLQAQMTKLDCP
jgi:hypothetical protein